MANSSEMKERICTSLSQMFCPSCHRKVNSPLGGAKIEGTIRIGCSCGNGICIVEGKIPVNANDNGK